MIYSLLKGINDFLSCLSRDIYFVSFALTGLRVESYGTGTQVRLPGRTAMEPRIYKFGSVPYDEMYNSMTSTPEDEDFFKTKGSMQWAGTLDAKKLLTLLKVLTYAKLKTRMNFNATEDDFIYLFLTIRSSDYEEKINNKMVTNLQQLLKDGYINVSDAIVDELDALPNETTYEGYKMIEDIFMF